MCDKDLEKDKDRDRYMGGSERMRALSGNIRKKKKKERMTIVLSERIKERLAEHGNLSGDMLGIGNGKWFSHVDLLRGIWTVWKGKLLGGFVVTN